jgi:hypothetical protein
LTNYLNAKGQAAIQIDADLQDPPELIGVRGMIASMGYPQIGIAYDRVARISGRTKFNIRALVRLSIDGVCSQSLSQFNILRHSVFSRR